MFTDDVMSLLLQRSCGAIHLIDDNARSHADSVTASVEQIPPLRPFSKSVGMAKRKRNQQRSNTMDRWTAERRIVSTPFTSPVKVTMSKLTKTISPTLRILDSRSTADNQDLSPRLVRRIPSNDGMESYQFGCPDEMKASPRRPTRKESLLNMCGVVAIQNIPKNCSSFDFSPRKPERRRLSTLPESHGKLKESSSTTTAQFIIEALTISNLYVDCENVDNVSSSDESTVGSITSTTSNTDDSKRMQLSTQAA
jgi:hypothetical protein